MPVITSEFRFMINASDVLLSRVLSSYYRVDRRVGVSPITKKPTYFETSPVMQLIYFRDGESL